MDITLRGLTEDDLDVLCQWSNHSEVSRFLGSRLKTRDQALAWFQRITGDPSNLLKGIIVDNQLVGYGIVEDVNVELGKCQVGVVVGKTDLWGKGIGKTVAGMLLKHCFDTLELHRVLAVIAKGNDRSERLFKSLGFVHEGTLREAAMIDGEHTDLLCYSMLKREYKQRGSNKALQRTPFGRR
jgi:RimJ/RimL family protein N-acetyltransferase